MKNEKKNGVQKFAGLLPRLYCNTGYGIVIVGAVGYWTVSLHRVATRPARPRDCAGARRRGVGARRGGARDAGCVGQWERGALSAGGRWAARHWSAQGALGGRGTSLRHDRLGGLGAACVRWLGQIGALCT